MTKNDVFIIAEAGVNHNGSEDLALSLVDAAAKAGADAVKFQTFKADKLVCFSAPKAEYQIRNGSAGESQAEMLRRLELSYEFHKVLIQRCREKSIEFISSPFDIESIDFLASLGISALKIPSGEITNLPYLRRAGACGMKIILSTGMCIQQEIAAALEVLEKAGTPRSKISLLHCTTEYPAAFKDLNLRAINTLKEAFGCEVGYSDHSEGIEAASAAVALGAGIIEKHFTLDRTLPGPDHKASIDPLSLAALVRSVRNISLALGDGVKKPCDVEFKNMKIARKSIVASSFIRQGEPFSTENITVKRPGTGISPMKWDRVLGLCASRDYMPDEIIQEDIE